ncbi:MAG: cell wall hydrolase, partial [Rhodospirillaceae bacterium]
MTDEETVARTVWGEARGEPFNGKIAIAWVIRNRVELDLHGDEKPDWWGEGYEAVCLKPWQFSCWNANDPNREKLLAVTDADAMYRDSLDAARLVIAGKVDDPTGGATH